MNLLFVLTVLDQLAVCCLDLCINTRSWCHTSDIAKVIPGHTLREFGKESFAFASDTWPLTDNEEGLLTSFWCKSALLMNNLSIHCMNSDCWMTWLWPVGMRGRWAFTMSWTEWHIYQVTVRLFLPSCLMNSPCEC